MSASATVSLTRRAILFSCLLALAISSPAQEAAVPVKILFLGNSYTFYNDMHLMVGRTLADQKKFAPQIEAYLQGGYRWEQHASDSQAIALIQKRAWDVVVLQEQSVLSAQAAVNEDVKTMMQNGLHSLISTVTASSPGAVIIVMQNWARHQRQWTENVQTATQTGDNAADAWARIRKATAAAVSAAKERRPGLNIVIAPVGDFWKLAQEKMPSLALHHEDGSHPAPLGSWFTALIISGTIGGREVIEQSNWTGSIDPVAAKQLKKLLLDHPEIFKQAGK
jgi:hypothetical protein